MHAACTRNQEAAHTKDEERQRKEAALQLLPSRRELPIWSQRKKLVSLVRENGTVVLVGETGSGKTTQAPQFVQMKLNPPGLVGCTQPRRIAAVTVAQRVAIERASRLGVEVGYSVRFDDTSSDETKVRLYYTCTVSPKVTSKQFHQLQ
jgi:HrpA-like RNA helicase